MDYYFVAINKLNEIKFIHFKSLYRTPVLCNIFTAAITVVETIYNLFTFVDNYLK